MKALILADLQGLQHDDWQRFLKIDQEQFDVIFLLGDIDQMLLEKLGKTFEGKSMIGVHGNHDYAGDLEYYGIDNVHAKVIERQGMTIGGIEGSHRYKQGDFIMFTQAEAILLCKELQRVDVLLCHNSPRGIHDKSDSAHHGFLGLLDYISRHKPKFLIHGHQHVIRQTKLEDTWVIGVYGGVIMDLDTLHMTQVLSNVE